MSDRSLSDYWQTDLLDRAREALIVIDFIHGRVAERQAAGKVASYVLNLDAGWGKGKTFFLNGLKAQIEHEGSNVVYVNAWEDDHATDPLIAVVAALETELAGPGKKHGKSMKLVTALAGEVALSAGKIIGLAAGKHLLGEHATGKVAELSDSSSVPQLAYSSGIRVRLPKRQRAKHLRLVHLSRLRAPCPSRSPFLLEVWLDQFRHQSSK